MTISATDIVVPVCSKIPLLYLLTQKVAQKFGYVLGIKNIIKIEVTEAEKLKSVIFPARHLCILPRDVDFRQIQVKNPSSCEISDKIESKVRIFTSKLTFKSCEQIDSDGIPLAYRITTADGCRYLIGRDHRPFPVLTRSELMPSSHTDSSLITYTVTWSDVIKPLQIIE